MLMLSICGCDVCIVLNHCPGFSSFFFFFPFLSPERHLQYGWSSADQKALESWHWLLESDWATLGKQFIVYFSSAWMNVATHPRGKHLPQKCSGYAVFILIGSIPVTYLMFFFSAVIRGTLTQLQKLKMYAFPLSVHLRVSYLSDWLKQIIIGKTFIFSSWGAQLCFWLSDE